MSAELLPKALPVLVPTKPRDDAITAATNGRGEVFRRQPGEALAELIRRATRRGIGFDVILLEYED